MEDLLLFQLQVAMLVFIDGYDVFLPEPNLIAIATSQICFSYPVCKLQSHLWVLPVTGLCVCAVSFIGWFVGSFTGGGCGWFHCWFGADFGCCIATGFLAGEFMMVSAGFFGWVLAGFVWQFWWRFRA
ncbi:hypothetical protein RHSIM_Rhsim01G0203400 [Rhododendron simsii]|uniref:Uncharacterized protein n=1 Tax=Rhododendron simsii TaxID=118357 RepID=A0A834HDQ3_RHOSS|nr:hypothetical protein RHSIM_Rhsim01G0203400 [Rhododendron simsii]